MKHTPCNTFNKLILSQCVLLYLTVSVIAEATQGDYTFDKTLYTNGTVRVVRIYDSILYVGGEFSKVYDKTGSYTRRGLAAINLQTRRVTDFKADINSGAVRSIFLHNGLLYAGGTFTKVNNIARSKLVALHPETGKVIETFSSSSANFNGSVFAVACLNNTVYAGGNFTTVNGIDRSYLAALDAQSGEVVLSINPGPCDSMDYDGKMDGGVFALDVYQKDTLSSGLLFVGGNFQTICGISGKKFLVALKEDGTPGPDFNKKIAQAVDAMECRDSVLYVGYAGFGNRPAAYKIGSKSLTELWMGYLVNGDVQAVTCSDKGYLFFGFHQGLFDTTDLYRCAVIEASTGRAYDVLPPMGSFFGVYTLDSYKNFLVAGGTFRKIGTIQQNYLAVFNMPPYPVQRLPLKVLLKTPVNDTILTSQSVTLKWHLCSYADSFDIEMASDSLFTNIIVKYSGVTGFEKKYSSLQRATRYFWRVRGVNKSGTGEWSDCSRFARAPGSDEIPRILKPSDGAKNIPPTFVCTWNSESKAVSYRLQVSPQSSFDSIVIDTIIGSDTATTIRNLLYNTTYYLRLQAQTVAGPSDWRTVDFTTEYNRLPLPIAVSPENGKKQVSLPVLLIWKTSSGAEMYNLQVSKEPEFNTIMHDIQNWSDTVYEFNNLETNTCYFWRLQSVSHSGQSYWSEALSFTTAPGSEYSPAIIAPANHTTDLALPVVCTWYRISDASGYAVQISKHSDFKNCMLDIANLEDTSIFVNFLENRETYHIRVRSTVSGGLSEWTYCTFTTIPKIPRKPKQLNPADNTDLVELTPQLTWTHDETANAYRIQLSDDATFSTLLLDSTLNDTLCSVNTLDYETCYFWRVRALNEAGEECSSPVTFTTKYSLPEDPVPLYPRSPVKVSTDSVTFKWSRSQPHVTQYHLEIAYDSAMNENIVSILTSDTTFQLKRCHDNETYYWRVQAINLSGEGVFSSAATFTTSFAPLFKSALHTIRQIDNNRVISYSNGTQSDISISLFNLKGMCIWEFKSNKEPPGLHTKKIDTRLLPGKYVLKFKTGRYLENKEVIILR